MSRELTIDIEVPRWVYDYIAHSPYLNMVRCVKSHPIAAKLRGVICKEDRRSPRWDGLVGMYLDNDIHRFSTESLRKFQQDTEAYEFRLCPYAFSILPDWLEHMRPEDRHRMVLCPHTVPDGLPLNREPGEPSGFMVASGNKRPYPMLWDVQHRTLSRMTIHRHPGYANPDQAKHREQWFPMLARHRIGVVGLGWGGPGGYVLAKYMEYMYAGMLLMAERPQGVDCEALGLVDGENCLLFTWPDEAERFETLYESAIVDFSQFESIAAAGQKLAVERHSAERRLDYIERTLDYFIERGGIPPVEWQLEQLRGGRGAAVGV